MTIRPDPTGTLIYTHGTGTRKSGFDKDWAYFRREARDRGWARASLIDCAWGPKHREGVPDADLVSSVLPSDDLESEIAALDDARWDLLVRDPGFELRLAAAMAGGVATEQAEPMQSVSEGLEAIQAATTDSTPVSARMVRAAARRVAAWDELRAAETAFPSYPEAVRTAAARAVVADILHRQNRWRPTEQGSWLSSRAGREVLTGRLADELGGREAAEAPWAETFDQFAVAADWPSRACVTQMAAEFFADVFWYLRWSDVIAKELAERITLAQSRRPVVVVAHSLGGIAAIDLLSNPERDSRLNVDMLVTFGTQAGLVYAMDAMRHAHLPLYQPRAGAVPRWVNFFGTGDLISFRVGPLAALTSDLRETPVAFSARFPESHSQYIRLDEFWDTMRGAWPDPIA